MRREQQDADAGLSLIELLVAMLVTGILVTVVGTVFVTTNRTAADARSAQTAVGTASVVMNELRRTLRVATDVQTGATTTLAAVAPGTAFPATARDLTVHTWDVVATWDSATAGAPAPIRAELAVDPDGYLVVKRTAGVLVNDYWAFPGAPTTARVAGPVVATADPIFRYYDRTGAALTPTSTGLSDAQKSRVAAVEVTVTAPNTARGASDPVVLVDRVTFINLIGRT